MTLKTPHWPDVVGVVLIVVVLVAIVEVLVPRVVRIVLRRGPVVVIHESSNTDCYRHVLAPSRNLKVALLNFLWPWESSIPALLGSLPIAFQTRIIAHSHQP